jgi:hypothetical protein
MKKCTYCGRANLEEAAQCQECSTEFSRFYPADFEHGGDFLAVSDAFLAKIPKGGPYEIEMRNRLWLTPEYFACLARHGVTYV